MSTEARKQMFDLWISGIPMHFDQDEKPFVAVVGRVMDEVCSRDNEALFNLLNEFVQMMATLTAGLGFEDPYEASSLIMGLEEDITGSPL